MTTKKEALSELGGVVDHAVGAWQCAKRAADGLEGARKTRAKQLVDQLADVVAFSERLEFIVEGDVRAEVTR